MSRKWLKKKVLNIMGWEENKQRGGKNNGENQKNKQKND